MLYLHAVDQANSYKPAKRDRITLDAAKLKDAQGVYTCPATPESSKSDFHCCLELQETQVLHQVRLCSLCTASANFNLRAHCFQILCSEQNLLSAVFDLTLT